MEKNFKLEMTDEEIKTMVKKVFDGFDLGEAIKKILLDGYDDADDYIKYGNAFRPLDFTKSPS